MRVQTASELTTAIVESGHMYAFTHAARGLSGPLALAEKQGGLSHVRFMASVAKQRDPAALAEKLKVWRRRV